MWAGQAVLDCSERLALSLIATQDEIRDFTSCAGNADAQCGNRMALRAHRISSLAPILVSMRSDVPPEDLGCCDARAQGIDGSVRTMR
jgi:hypothetical protein